MSICSDKISAKKFLSLYKQAVWNFALKCNVNLGLSFRTMLYTKYSHFTLFSKNVAKNAHTIFCVIIIRNNYFKSYTMRTGLDFKSAQFDQHART
jgi:hypothetical protein